METITAKQFEDQVAPMQVLISEKKKELEDLTNQFLQLTNSVRLDDEEDAEEIENIIGNVAYDLGLEWSGTFDQGEVEFWQASSC